MPELPKRKRLLSSAYKLFTTKGINKTTIQDIVDAAKVAKGTFYLYFEDKYKIQEELVIEKSKEIFNESIKELNNHKINKFDDQVIFIVDYIIDYLDKNPEMLNFISKDLSMGLYQDKLSNIIGNKETGLYEMFIKGASDNKIDNPNIKLFMIIEFVSSTIYSIITKRADITIDEYKPFLHSVIKDMLK